MTLCTGQERTQAASLLGTTVQSWLEGPLGTKSLTWTEKEIGCRECVFWGGFWPVSSPGYCFLNVRAGNSVCYPKEGRDRLLTRLSGHTDTECSVRFCSSLLEFTALRLCLTVKKKNLYGEPELYKIFKKIHSLLEYNPFLGLSWPLGTDCFTAPE